MRASPTHFTFLFFWALFVVAGVLVVTWRLRDVPVDPHFFDWHAPEPEGATGSLGAPVAVSATGTGKPAAVVPPPAPIMAKPLPAHAQLAVPFQPQAPFASWKLPYREACEEASAIMAAAFFNKETLSAKRMDARILEAVAWEKRVLGAYLDTDAAQTARILREHLGMSGTTVQYDFTVDDVKRAIVAGNPVIILVAGREIGNPHYVPPAPVYHALVITGFTGSLFITNDPGTKFGKGYAYEAAVLLKASHEWNAKDIDLGRPAIVVVAP